RVLEEGGLLFFPHLAFALGRTERGSLLSTRVSRKAKHVSFDMRSGVLRGSSLPPADEPALRQALELYARLTLALLRLLLPHYMRVLEQARTSFRPLEAASRPSSWRKDDRRLHLDAFPSGPVQGRRLLRVFSNINPEGRDRIWNIGQPFEAVARRYP